MMATTRLLCGRANESGGCFAHGERVGRHLSGSNGEILATTVDIAGACPDII